MERMRRGWNMGVEKVGLGCRLVYIKILEVWKHIKGYLWRRGTSKIGYWYR